MPIYKSRLTRTEQEDYLVLAQQLLAQGVELEIPDEWEMWSRKLDISIHPVHSSIYEVRRGITIYAVYVRLVSRDSNLTIEEFEIAPPWDHGVIACYAARDRYRFATSLDFEYEEVLNHRIEDLLRFHRRGDRAEGWILGSGMRPVPPDYGPGKPAPFRLDFVDQVGRVYSVSAAAAVERSARIVQPYKRRGQRLFDSETIEARLASSRRDPGDSKDLMMNANSGPTGSRSRNGKSGHPEISLAHDPTSCFDGLREEKIGQ